jgi:hypothetical protein
MHWNFGASTRGVIIARPSNTSYEIRVLKRLLISGGDVRRHHPLYINILEFTVSRNPDLTTGSLPLRREDATIDLACPTVTCHHFANGRRAPDVGRSFCRMRYPNAAINGR